jgi:integrase
MGIVQSIKTQFGFREFVFNAGQLSFRFLARSDNFCRTRDMAVFNLAIDNKLRGCDVVALRVEDIAACGYTADRATVRQKKTGRPVRFELSEQTRQAVDDYLKATRKRPGEFLFT